MSWTKERTELAVKLWRDGYSGEYIATRLGGITRNAVVGKMHRLGLPSPSGSGQYQKARNPSKVKPHVKKHPMQRAAATSDVPRHRVPLPPASPSTYVEQIIVPVGQRKKLLDLDAADCRWPIGDPQHADFHFCNGVRVIGREYCEHHLRVAYQPAAAQRAKPKVVVPQVVKTLVDA